MCRKTSRLKSSQSMVSNQQDHDPPSRPERHSSPQSPSTATHHEPPPRSWSNARTRCQCDTGFLFITTGWYTAPTLIQLNKTENRSQHIPHFTCPQRWGLRHKTTSEALSKEVMTK
ncbi:unnamed protein product [Pleuronectes platessa]|uniref:Uncharacterized protein n=1 Tax=Pleuronectes platessa TaxID=8262 RepID=A0A9N7YUJ8_PLEPL|nr:unnamed protein product [Pleuronectes platessa]